VSTTLGCINCGKVLTTAFTDDHEFGQPGAATMFTSHGNYGSTVFDLEPGGKFLLVHVCDECLLAAAELGDVAIVTPGRPADPRYKNWDPQVSWCPACQAGLPDEHKCDDDAPPA
jgi:hypothetical protein